MNQVVKKEAITTVRSQLEKMKGQIALALPKHITPDRLLRVALTCIQNTPKLLECDRQSLFSSVMTCAQLGLEPDGVLGQAYLIPFGKQVQFIAGYKGLISLARNSGEVISIKAEAVYKDDEFNYEYGLNEQLHHKPSVTQKKDENIIFFYAYAKFKDGGYHFEVMTRDEVEQIKEGSQGYKAFKNGLTKTNPWVTNFAEMGKKTAIRRIAKYLPLVVQRAASYEDMVDAGKYANTDFDSGAVLIEEVVEENEKDITPEESKKGTSSLKEKMKAQKEPVEEAKEEPQIDKFEEIKTAISEAQTQEEKERIFGERYSEIELMSEEKQQEIYNLTK